MTDKIRRDEADINAFKQKLGYSGISSNLMVQTKLNYGIYALIGVISLFSMHTYNLSMEDGGLLFIQRSSWTGKILKREDKVTFIPQAELESVKFDSGAARWKMTLTNAGGKKLKYQIPKLGQQERISALMADYEK